MDRAITLVACLAALVLGACSGPASPGGDTGGGGNVGRALFRNGQPVKNSRIRVTGCAEQTTGTDGTFDTQCAAPSYDVALVYGNVGLLYRNVTRRDPVITMPFGLGSAQTCTVTGTATGLVSGRAAAVLTTSASYSALLDATTDGTFSNTLQWFGATPPTATVRALEWTPATGLPTSYTGYGTATTTLTAGGTPTADPALVAVTSGAIGAAITDFDLASLNFSTWIGWPDGGVAELAKGPPGGTSKAIATPDVAGATYAVVAERGSNPMSWAWRRGLASNDAPDAMTLPVAATFTAPAAAAIVDLTTDFTWSPVTDAVYLVGFEAGGPSFTPLLYVVTNATSARIPDFGWAGLGLPVSATMTASVRAVAPCASMDEATLATAVLSLSPTAWVGSQANRIPAVDGVATRHHMSVTTPP